MEYFEIEETDLWAYVSKTADDEIVQKVEKWMNSSAFNENLFIKISTIYKNTSQEDVNVAQAKNRFFKTIKPKKQVVWKQLLKYAAIVVFFISSLYTYNNFTLKKDKVIVQTNFGEQKNITLSDGSIVWLNASTTLSYHKENPRELYLEGEGFFEVTKDKLHPFTVTTSDDITVKALGTSFNVKSYKESSVTETKLLTGKVEVSSAKHFNNVLMNPNDKLVFHKKSRQIEKFTMDYSEAKIAWKEGEIQFKNKTFKEIAIQLKAQFNIKIKFKNEAIANSKFTGSFENSTAIAEIFEILKISKDFNYQLNTENNEWMIN